MVTDAFEIFRAAGLAVVRAWTIMKKIIGSIVFITIVMSDVVFADTYRFELNAGHSSVGVRFDIIQNLDQGLLITGIGGVYKNDDYKIANVKVALGGSRRRSVVNF